MSQILVIEDEESIAHALELALTKAGFTVTICLNGAIGIEILKHQTFDIILTDLLMPDIDGFGVLAWLKEHNIDTPVFVLSNLSDTTYLNKAKEAGAKDFFIKSDVPIHTIIDKVRETLSK